MNEEQIKNIEIPKPITPPNEPEKIVTLPEWSIEPPLQIMRDEK